MGELPKSAAEYHQRGDARLQAKDYDSAIGDFSRAIRAGEVTSALFVKRSEAKRMANDYNGALTDAAEAIRLDPHNPEAHYTRGMVHCVRIIDYHSNTPVDWNAAIADFTEAIRLNPQYFSAYLNRAVARCNAGDFDGGMSDCVDAIYLKPDDPEIYRIRGMLYHFDGQYAVSTMDLYRSIELGVPYPMEVEDVIRLNEMLRNPNHPYRDHDYQYGA